VDVALTRERIVATAVDLLRRYGLADLTMRRLARELDVQPGALYWHVANKQELLVEVTDVLLGQVPRPAADADPVEALAGLAAAVRDALARVPDAADVVGVAYAVEPGSSRPLRDLAALVRRTGVPAAERDAVSELVLHHVLGSVRLSQERASAAGAVGEGVVADAESAAKAFEVGLGVILAGLRA
jgi:TetR/AcrR family tetracycline transcriptional repressor